MRILVSGSRSWTDRDAIEDAVTDWILESGCTIADVRDLVIVHGGAPGADTLAGEVAALRGWAVEVHEADWGTWGRAAGPMRNAKMVKLGADVLLAFPIGVSRGTRGCMGLARRAGIPVRDCSQRVRAGETA